MQPLPAKVLWNFWYTKKINTQKIIVVSGLPGSGKSTVAETVAKRLQSPYLRHCTI